MPQLSKRKLNKVAEGQILDILKDVIVSSRSSLNPSSFIELFLTPTEYTMIAKRVAIAILVKRGYTYELIKDYLKVSQSTISGIINQLKVSSPSNQSALDKVINDRNLQKIVRDFELGLRSLLPPKGGDWSTWRRNLEQDKRQSETPL